jgi:hypothetical protein
LVEIAKREGVGRTTLYRRFLQFKKIPKKRQKVSCLNQVIIVDGTYLERNLAVLIARTKTQVIGWWFCSQECFENWRIFLVRLDQPKVVVCDGQKGLIKAIESIWDEVIIQRCLFHIQARCLTRLTQNPTETESKSLRVICRQICSLDTWERQQWWFNQYCDWKEVNQDFLKQQAIYYHPKTNQMTKVYLHKQARAVIASIDRTLPYMFHYLNDPDIPKTTNLLEGGINSRLKELIYRHRGLSLKNKLVLTQQYLKGKQFTRTLKTKTNAF